MRRLALGRRHPLAAKMRINMLAAVDGSQWLSVACASPTGVEVHVVAPTTKSVSFLMNY